MNRHVANERDGVGERRVPLALFLAVGQGRDARPLFAEGDLGVDAAHQRELRQPFGLDVDVGADVEHDARALQRW